MITIRNEDDFSAEAKKQLENSKSKAKYAFDAIEHFANSEKVQKMFLNELRYLTAEIQSLREENAELRELLSGLGLKSNVIDLSEAKANRDQQGISHENDQDNQKQVLPEDNQSEESKPKKDQNQQEENENVNTFGSNDKVYNCYISKY